MIMKKTALALFLIIFLGASVRFNNVDSAKAGVFPLSPSVIYVPGNFSTIQAAVDAANASDTILVANGTYREQVTIDKPLALFGEDRSNTIIDANGDNYAVKIKSSNVTLSGFTVQNTTKDPVIAFGGIWLDGLSNAVSNVTITNCTVIRCLFAVWFRNALNNTFRENEFTNNNYDFGFTGESPRYFVQDIDTSNTVNGKPVYWWIKQHDQTVPLDAGMVAAVNCTGIIVKDLTFAKNRRSVMFVCTNDSLVENVTSTNSDVGISLFYSYNNTIRDNSVSFSSHFGIVLTYSSNNTIYHNDVSDCVYNLKLVASHQNRITANTLTHANDMYGLILDEGCLYNTVADNTVSFNTQGGIGLDDQSRWNTFTHNFVEGNMGIDGGLLLFDGSSDNLVVENTFLNNLYGIKAMSGGEFFTTCRSVIYKNNFINNTNPPYHDQYTQNHTWDNGAEGNFWSDFVGDDADLDGISETAYAMDADNVDRYPLMEPWSRNRTYAVSGTPFSVSMVSNSTVGGFNFNQTLRQIAFNVTGPAGSKGSCNVTIPKLLLNVSTLDEWAIEIDGIVVTPTQTIVDNGTTYTYFYLTYDFTTHNIKIIGTNAYPEFPVTAVFLLVFVFAALSVGVLRRKWH
jgi:parallel beta-helix repeat protein